MSSSPNVKFKVVYFMKLLNYSIIVSGLLLLTGCASHHPVWNSATDGAPVESSAKVATSSERTMKSDLATAADSVSTSLKRLAAINVYEQSKRAKLPFANIHDPALNTIMPDVNYYGPARILLRTVAKNIGYQLQTYGKAPATPILVQVDDTSTPITAKEIITDVTLQAGKNATIIILPKQKIISLRYSVR